LRNRLAKNECGPPNRREKVAENEKVTGRRQGTIASEDGKHVEPEGEVGNTKGVGITNNKIFKESHQKCAR